MSAIIRIHCDGEWREGVCLNRTAPWPDLAMAQASIERDQWLTHGTRHFCPDCQRAGRHDQAVTR